MWTYLALYLLGAVVTNLIIYFHDDEEKEQSAVNIASILWPVTWAIYCVLVVEKCLKCIWKFCARILNDLSSFMQ